MKEIAFFIPVPPKPCWTTRQRRTYPDKIREYIPNIHLGERIKTEESYEVEVSFHTDTRSDIDNMLKGLLDVMCGRVIRDDCQIQKITAERVRISKQNPVGIMVKIKSI